MTSQTSIYNDRFFRRRTDISKCQWQVRLGRDIVRRMGIKSLVDFGCGIGTILEGAQQEGVSIIGYEINDVSARKYAPECIKNHIKFGDMSEAYEAGDTFDCALSIEVAEHLPEDSADLFVKNLIAASHDLIIVTAAHLGQRGKGHINCQKIGYWIDKFTNRGCRLCSELVRECKQAWADLDVAGFVTDNLMIFETRGSQMNREGMG